MISEQIAFISVHRQLPSWIFIQTEVACRGSSNKVE